MKTITKKQFSYMCLGIITIGVLAQSGLYYYASIGNLTLMNASFMFCAGIITGVGMALANSRSFKIEEFDK